MPSQPQSRLRIGAFVIDPSLDEVSGAGAVTKLEPRAMDVLVYLARRAGEVVSIEELLAHTWAGVIVTPDSVYRAIAAIRRAFADDPRSARYIANVPRRGYRLIAPVSPFTEVAETVPTEPALAEASSRAPQCSPAPQASDPAADMPAVVRVRPVGVAAAALLALALIAGGVWVARITSVSAPASPMLGDKSIAVLPFQDMSEAHDQGYFVDGLTEQVLDLLTRVPGLQVIARTSSFSFRGSAADVPTIARQLRVAHVLEGSVRKSGDHLRITTQLIRADNGVHLWSETYEREARDVFEVQDEIAAAVVSALRIQLLPSQVAPAPPRATSMVAYNEYLLGREFQNRGTTEGYHRAAEAFDRAITLDPGYAPAYAGLAVAGILVADESGTTTTRIEPSLAAADRAITLAPDQADGYAARGYLRFSHMQDWRGAQADFDKALTREPGNGTLWRGYADLLASMGHLSQAIAADRKATALDPFAAPAWGNLGMYLAAHGDYDEAERALQRAVEIAPDAAFALNGLATLKLIQGRADEARALYQRIGLEGFRLTGTAMAEHSLGHAPESNHALAEALARADGWSYEIAEAYAWRGDTEQAFTWLERAYAERDPGVTGLLADPLLRGVRDAARYEALVRRMNLPTLDDHPDDRRASLLHLSATAGGAAGNGKPH